MRRQSLPTGFYKFLMAVAVGFGSAAPASAAVFERTVHAPGGVGDVTELTNVLVQLVGAYDIYGGPRFIGNLDIGAAECDLPAPGLGVVVR